MIEVLNQMLMTTYGIGISLTIASVWMLYCWERVAVESKERVWPEPEGHIYTIEEYPDPKKRAAALMKDMGMPVHVKVKSFKTFETPLAIHKKPEPGYMWESLKACLTLPGIVFGMLLDTLNDFKNWSVTNYMFYVGVAGFAGLYYGGMLLLTNPVVQEADKTIFVLVGLMLLAVGNECINRYKEEEDEPKSSVAVPTN